MPRSWMVAAHFSSQPHLHSLDSFPLLPNTEQQQSSLPHPVSVAGGSGGAGAGGTGAGGAGGSGAGGTCESTTAYASYACLPLLYYAISSIG
ncbi:unnamed protein product [Closterium sp. NIES-54]